MTARSKPSGDVLHPGKIALPRWYFPLTAGLAATGFGTFAYGLGVDPHRAWGSYLVGFFFVLCVSLAGPFFVAAQYLASAGWSVTVRRVPEAMSAALVPLAVLAAGLFVGAHHLYHWSHHEAVAGDLLLSHKAPYLNLTRMGVSTALAFLIWIGLAGWLTANSRLQDQTGDATLTRRNAYVSALFMVLFALTFSVAGVDFLMSLDPHWFSTLWAVYLFAMLMQSGMALITLIVVVVRGTGVWRSFVGPSHVHDLGKLTFAFTVFWAYIAFSQFLLIWYANLPEEITFYLRRLHLGWGSIAVALVVGKFAVPFLVLLPRRHKHTPAIVGTACAWILGMTFVELWWLVMPALSHGGPSVPWMEALVLGGFVGVFLAAFGASVVRHAAVPVKDPYLDEAIQHQA